MRSMIINSLVITSVMVAAQAYAAGADDPLLTMIQVDQLEKRDASSGEPLVWDIQGWAGYDLKKIRFKTEGERTGGETESAELQLLYSQAIASYWDIQAGVRHDFYPRPEQDWAVIGVQGIAPYYFEIDASFFWGESGQTSLRLEAEYELLLTQQWILSPEIEINIYGKDDEERDIGSGLAELEAGLRLRYEVRREFAPYVGINWEKLFGNTADLSRAEGEDTDDLQFVLGIRGWF